MEGVLGWAASLCVVRKYSRRRFGDLEVQGRNVVHVATGVAVAGDDFSVKLTLEKFMDQSSHGVGPSSWIMEKFLELFLA